MPKVKYTKGIILEKAMKRASEVGLKELTVRDLAKEIGCSVAPIYTAFGSFEELISQVKKAYWELTMKYAMEEYSENTFLNIGIGGVRLALEYPKVYQELFLGAPISEEGETCSKELLEVLYRHPLGQWLSHEELDEMMLKMEIFTEGICAQIVVGNRTELNLERCKQLLRDAGQEIIIGTLVKKGVYEGYVNHMSK